MDLIERQAAIDTLNVGAELLRRVLDDADVVGVERAKYEWGLGLIESYIEDIEELPSALPEPYEYAVSATAVEEMLKNLLPERGMWEIEGDEAKTAVCETVHDALEGLWRLPFVKPHSNGSSLTQEALDTISRQVAIDHFKSIAGATIIGNKYHKGFVDGLDFAVAHLKTMPSALPELIEKAAYIRGFEQGRTQGMIDAQGGKI